MAYEHLRFNREVPITDRFRKRPPMPFIPEDPKAYGAGLLNTFDMAKKPSIDELPGYDSRILFKLQLRDTATVPELDKIPGVELISQEDKTIVIAFADETGLDNFESRLSSLVRDGKATRSELLYALEAFEHWTAEDRMGPALMQYGFPEEVLFVLDIELWPLIRSDQRGALLASFLDDLQKKDIQKLDTINLPSLILVRIRCTKSQAESILLKHRDVRMVDLPPKPGVTVKVLLTDINQIPQVHSPPVDCPAVAVLDSGLTTSHPVLANAVGDSQGYLAPNRSTQDSPPDWHGTFVAGLALYGDIHECIKQGEFIPQLRLFSGKVFEDGNNNQTMFVENAVAEAVRDLHEHYGCRVFNLSYGDSNKVYDGKHVRGLAYTLDSLTRELDVLFVVPTGNIQKTELPEDPYRLFPDYLFSDHSRLLDPATAINALVIGGLAQKGSTLEAQKHPETIEDYPIARNNQPFPLNRSGFSVGGAIKPDLVDYAGNLAVKRTGSSTRKTGLGIVSTNGGFAGGRPFVEDIGTSYAAPLVAHRAALLLNETPNASANLLRALLAAHASWPKATVDLLEVADKSEHKQRILRVIGYGHVDDDALYRSIDQAVTLLAEDSITNDKCHFYELPIPQSFWSTGKRQREVTVALAYSPDISTTRLEYRMSKLWYTLVRANNLDQVEKAFKKNREEDMGELSSNRWISNARRKAGTLQVSRWEFKIPPRKNEKIFVVVTRQDTIWGTVSDTNEPYSLVVVLSDKENAQANLYAETRAQLESRVQARARARI